MRNRCFLCILFSALSGCGDSITSAQLETEQIYADVDVRAENSQTRVVVILRSGTSLGTPIQLIDGDSLSVSAYSQNKVLSGSSALVDAIYRAEYGQNVGDEIIRVSLTRETKSSAPDSWGRLPQVVNVSAPLANEVIPRGDGILVQWEEGNGGSMTLDVTSECMTIEGERVTQSISQALDDDGEHRFDTQALNLPENLDVSENCQLAAVLTRTIKGSLDENYAAGGTFVARQVKSIPLSLSL